MLGSKIRSLFKRKVVIPEYAEKRAIILFYKNKYRPDVFVETGTFMGDTVKSLLNDFKKLYSIELSEDLALRAQERFAPDKNVTIIQGDSAEQLKIVVENLKETALFWLDGHYSGEFMYNDEFIKTAKGKLDTPVLTELEHILSSNYPHIILIDDARLFNGMGDYPTINQLKKIVSAGKMKNTLSVERDIIRIVSHS